MFVVRILLIYQVIPQVNKERKRTINVECLKTIIQNVEATTLFHPNIKIKEDNQI